MPEWDGCPTSTARADTMGVAHGACGVSMSIWLSRWLIALAMFVWLAHPSTGRAATLSELLAQADRVRTADPDRLGALLQRADTLAADANDAERDHLSLLHAYAGWRAGNYGAAVTTARRLSRQAATPTLRYRATLLVANLAAVAGDYTMGADYLARASDLERAVPDPAVRDVGLGVAATLYNQFDQFELAELFSRQLLQHARTQRSRCFALENLARALVARDRVTSEQVELLGPLKVCRDAAEPMVISMLHASRARYLNRTGRHAEAVQLLQSELEGARATRYTRLVAEYESLLAEGWLGLGKLVPAAQAAQRALELSEPGANWAPVLAARGVLYQTHKRTGQAARALEHLEALSDGERARLKDLQARERAHLAGQLAVLRQQRLADTLRLENTTLQLERRMADQRRRVVLLLVAILCVVVVILSYWGWRMAGARRALKLISERDPLTGASNRRHFSEKARAVLGDAARENQPVSLVLLDLDNFKSINDRAGHAVGDSVLVEIARLGRLHCAAGDTFGRLGGEEYGFCLPDRTREQAHAIAERFLDALRQSTLYTHADGSSVTASGGVSCTEEFGYDFDALLRAADVAMYRAKEKGRNRVKLADPAANG